MVMHDNALKLTPIWNYLTKNLRQGIQQHIRQQVDNGPALKMTQNFHVAMVT